MNGRVTEARERFARDTAEHEMQVLRDDGLYRHLRFQRPGTSMYYFDLVTWPGYLAIVGDAGDYMFSRTRDMVEFFAPSGARGGFEDAQWGINPDYWSEKLQGREVGRTGAKSYSADSFRRHVLAWCAEQARQLLDLPWDVTPDAEWLGRRWLAAPYLDAEDVADEDLHQLERAVALHVAVDDELLDPRLETHYADAARELINDFEHDGVRISDAWEWDLRDYDWQFLWCCWAIVWGIGQYRAALAAPGEQR